MKVVYNIHDNISICKMIIQTCAICKKNNFTVLYPENFDLGKIDEKIFSARRLPDRIHYRMVKCKNCGLVYSNPILEYDKLEKLYKKSNTTYDTHFENLKQTYGFYLSKLKKYVVSSKIPVSNDLRGAQSRLTGRARSRSEKHGIENLKLLEVGCGNGFFLEEALKQGYKHVYGIEPGKKSVQKANPKVRKNIIVDIFRPEIYKKNSLDIICCFQTFDHIPDPNSLLKECYKVLKKGGLMLFLNHDVGALPNRLMGEASPIIDIEHTYLFDKTTMQKIFKKHNFKILEIESASNIHALSHWVHLFPLPNFLKIPLLKVLKAIKLGDLKIKINPGNLVLFAQK